MIVQDWSKYAPFFEKEEFDCKCGCGLNNMQESHMDKIYEARKDAGIAFVIQSGSRCERHNRNEGGSDTSDHLNGFGTDIRAKSGRAKWKIEAALLKVGFNRMGRGMTFIHAGDDPQNPPMVCWTYTY
jgi:zinc D-Ala-D-Ala carboxypeptidase